MNYFYALPSLENVNWIVTPSTESEQVLLTKYDNMNCFLLHLVWYQNNFAQPECKAHSWRPVEKQQYVMANHYYLTRTYLLPAYVPDWILLSR
jgi:hypothetical protein